MTYVLCVLYITILSRTPALARTVRPIPFWSFLDWLEGNWARGGSIALNIILFIPLGYLLAGVRVRRRKSSSILICLAVTVAIETIQFVTYRGYFDTDDVIANFLGGLSGVLCYQRFSERLKKHHIPVILIMSGIVGCIISAENSQIYETQFDFQIQSVEIQDGNIKLSGTCSIYRRDFLPYQIQFKGKKEVFLAKTEIIDDQFIAIAEAPDEDCEVNVVFNGYQPISTGTYLNNGQIEYVIDNPKLDVSETDLEFIVKDGILKAYNAEYDVYVYQLGNRLYWLIGEDFDASVIYHLYTEEPENLPEERQQYGFDNRGFKKGSEKELTNTMNCGKYQVFSDIIPTEYMITAVAVGMNKGPDVFWREYFRLK